MTRRTFPLIGLALLAGLAACTTPPVAEWQPLEAPKTNEVALSRLTHSVEFAPGATRMSATERHRLASFIADADLMAGEHVYLETPRDDVVSRARQDGIRRILARRGILVGSVPADTASGSEIALGDTVTIELERYVVTPPDCPNWSKPTGGDPTNSVASNFGCTTATNLGLMVADPRDLIAGREPGPADAEPTLRAVENYRSGKSIALPSDLSGDSAPGASAATPGASAGAAGAAGGAGAAASGG